MRRPAAEALAAILAVELAYILWTTLPEFVPQPQCYPQCLDAAFVMRPLPWLWVGFAVLLFLNAVLLLLGKRLGIVLGFLTQAVALIGLARNISQEIGWSLSQGSLWSGINSWFPDVLFAILALCTAVGPAFALLVMMITTPATINRRMARVAALLLGSQLVALIAAALISFPLAFHGCDYPGIIVADAPGTCPDFANLDFGRLFALAIPSATILLLVCSGVWFGRTWALSAGIVWQALLVVVLVVVGATLWESPDQNYWYERFPLWTSPRYVADLLVLLAPVPTLAALLASRPFERSWRTTHWSGRRGSRSPDPKPNLLA
jgi:hypothetical protein